MPSTEVLRAPFKPNTTPQDLLQITHTIPTVGDVYWGYAADQPKTLRAFLDWDSVQAHNDFTASAAFQPFFANFHAIVAGEFTLWHIDFLPSLEAQHNALRAPVTVIQTYYPEESSSAGLIQGILAARETLAKQPGFVDLAVGVTHEEVEFGNGDGKGHPVVAVTGWKTREDWENFTESEAYKDKRFGAAVEGAELEEVVVDVAEMNMLKTA